MLLTGFAAVAFTAALPREALATADFEWLHPGGDPANVNGASPEDVKAALRTLNQDGFIPAWAVAELKGEIDRERFFLDQIPDTNDYFIHRMLFGHEGLKVARNVRARTKHLGWSGKTRDVRVYVAGQPGDRYYLILPKVCGNLAVRRVQYGRCVPDERLCDARCAADQAELQARQYHPQ